MIGKGKVFVLLLAALAAGVVLSAALNLSPRTNAFLGDGGKKTGEEGAVNPSGNLLRNNFV